MQNQRSDLQEKTILNETQLLQQLAAGNPAALQEIVKTYFPILCKFAEKYVPDVSIAKDIVQETFIKFWQYDSPFETWPGLKAFLFTVTRNGCLNWQRGKGREEDKHQKSAALAPLETTSAYDEITRLEQLALINAVVQSMPAKMQEVFLLSFQEGLSIEEIALKLNISAKTVRNQRYNSLTILRNKLGKDKSSLLLLLGFLLK